MRFITVRASPSHLLVRLRSKSWGKQQVIAVIHFTNRYSRLQLERPSSGVGYRTCHSKCKVCTNPSNRHRCRHCGSAATVYHIINYNNPQRVCVISATICTKCLTSKPRSLPLVKRDPLATPPYLAKRLKPVVENWRERQSPATPGPSKAPILTNTRFHIVVPCSRCRTVTSSHYRGVCYDCFEGPAS